MALIFGSDEAKKILEADREAAKNAEEAESKLPKIEAELAVLYEEREMLEDELSGIQQRINALENERDGLI